MHRPQFTMFFSAVAVLIGLSWPAEAQKPLRVVTTVSMLADTVRAVGSTRVEVTSLLGEGVDPHTYRPTRADIARLSSADLVVANGLHLEAQLDETLKALARSKPVLFAAEKIPAAQLLADEEYKDRKDPHVWMDPKLWSIVVEAVRDALIARDPAGRADYEAGAKNYIAEIRRLDAYAAKVLGTVPQKARVLVTAHDAFGYFGRAYGFEVEGIQGLSTESEAGLKRIEALVSLLVEKKSARLRGKLGAGAQCPGLGRRCARSRPSGDRRRRTLLRRARRTRHLRRHPDRYARS